MINLIATIHPYLLGSLSFALGFFVGFGIGVRLQGKVAR